MAPAGSCDFVNSDDPCLIDDFTDDLAQAFLTDLLDASGIQYLSPENYAIELTTFVLLNCDVDVMNQFHSLLVLLTGKRINLSFDQTKPLASVWQLLKAINVADFKIGCTGCDSLTRCRCVGHTFHRIEEKPQELAVTPMSAKEDRRFPAPHSVGVSAMAEDFVSHDTSSSNWEHSKPKSTLPPFHISDEIVADGGQTPPSQVRRLIGKYEAMSQPGGRPPDV